MQNILKMDVKLDSKDKERWVAPVLIVNEIKDTEGKDDFVVTEHNPSHGPS